MTLRLSPVKLVMMFWPIYILAAAGALLRPADWLQPIPIAVLALAPVVVFLLGGVIGDRWRLELTPTALLHHTLWKVEEYAWERMGPVELRLREVLRLPLLRTLWFRFPLDAPHSFGERLTKRTGRSLLLVFGDRSARETRDLIEAWRTGSRLG